jgi:hypothetical protein
MSPVERVVVDAVESDEDEDEAKVDALDLGCGAYSPPPATAAQCALLQIFRLRPRGLDQFGRAPVELMTASMNYRKYTVHLQVKVVLSLCKPK